MAIDNTKELFDWLLLNPGNTMGPNETVYAVISRDREGREAVCGFGSALGMQPMLTANPRLLKKIILPEARKAAARVRSQGVTIHLYRFTHREEIDFASAALDLDSDPDAHPDANMDADLGADGKERSR